LSLILTNVRRTNGTAVAIRIEGAVIAAAGPNVRGDPADTIIDGSGAFVLPGLVDSHVHLDKTYWGMAWRPHEAGADIRDRVQTERRQRAGLAHSVETRARALLDQLLSQGTTRLRTHVDIDSDTGLRQLEAVLAARQAVSHRMEIQVVAFPQSGVIIEAGAADLLSAALTAGADLIGGVDPEGFDQDADGQLGVLFGLSEKTGKGLDIHLHDGGESGARQIDQIIARTLALGLNGKVAISHGFCLGQVDTSRFSGLAEGLARAGIAIISHGGGAATPPPFRLLHDAGVVVAAGSDNIRDAWSPFGNGDMVERAMLVAWRSGFRRDEDIALALHMATDLAARALGVTDYGLAPGCRADLVTLSGKTLAEAVISRRPREVVIARGCLVVPGDVIAS